MFYKHNEKCRNKFTKQKYKVTNWKDYNESLRQRGEITIWFTEEAIVAWRPAKAGLRGRPMEYSDHAIETAILIRQVFHLPLRQTEGFMNSIARIMGAAIPRCQDSCRVG
ncbi:MAG: transposase [Sulfuriferula sp.]